MEKDKMKTRKERSNYHFIIFFKKDYRRRKTQKEEK